MFFNLAEINHYRIERLVSQFSNSIKIFTDLIDNKNQAIHLIKLKNESTHIVPIYGLDDIDIKKIYDQYLKDNNVTSAILPTSTVDNILINNNTFVEIKRPDLLFIENLNDKELLWTKLNSNKKINIKKYSGLLKFGIIKKHDDFINLFINAYIEIQKYRNILLLNYFDFESLKKLSELENVFLFFAVDPINPQTILFHLNILINDTLFYYFSTHLNDSARIFSASLHWYVVNWMIKEKIGFKYSLGGGNIQGDGIEKFKLQLGATAIPRRYKLYPKKLHKDDQFFPCTHKFLANSI